MHPSISTIIAIAATSYAITISSSSVVVAFQSPIIHRSLPIAKSLWTNHNIGAPINKHHHPLHQQQHYTTNTKLFNLKGGDYLDSLSNDPNSDDDGASSEVKEVSASISGTGTASIPNEIFNLVKSIVGAGVLSLPAGKLYILGFFYRQQNVLLQKVICLLVVRVYKFWIYGIGWENSEKRSMHCCMIFGRRWGI